MEILKRSFVFLQRSIWYLPLLSALLFWLYVLLMTQALGHSPRYDLDPLSTPGLNGFYQLMTPLLVLGFFSGLFCLLYLLLKIFFRKMSLHVYDVVFLLLGIILFMVNLQSSEMEWLLD